MVRLPPLVPLGKDPLCNRLTPLGYPSLGTRRSYPTHEMKVQLHCHIGTTEEPRLSPSIAADNITDEVMSLWNVWKGLSCSSRGSCRYRQPKVAATSLARARLARNITCPCSEPATTVANRNILAPQVQGAPWDCEKGSGATSGSVCNQASRFLTYRATPTGLVGR